jgi:1-acyl-sn-glycerol-3-phosphate acyltransferase
LSNFNNIRALWRLSWLIIYTLITLVTVPIIFNPRTDKLPKKRQFVSFLYRRIYSALNIKLIVHGEPTKHPSLWVSNHISWVDILLFAGGHTVDFIAKSEVGDWPLIGNVVKKTGTVLIDRNNKFQAYRSLPLLQQRMRSGTPVLVFPEGTTTSGGRTLPFKPMFYQAAIRENMLIQPISLHYVNSHGEPTDSIAFIDEDDFSISLRRILKQPRITAHIHFLPTLSADQYHRKIMARKNQKAINEKIKYSNTI